MSTSRPGRIVDTVDGLYRSRAWLVTAIVTTVVLNLLGLDRAPLTLRLVMLPFVLALWSPCLVHWMRALVALPGAFRRGLEGE
jgi:hypothetical protein